MDNLKGFIIYKKGQEALLNTYLQRKEECDYKYIPAIESELVRLLGAETLFDTKKSNNILKRKISNEEIAQTLSHIQYWKTILDNADIKENELVLIAEPDITLIKNYYSAIYQHVDKFLLNSHYNVILLQRSENDDFWDKQIYPGEGEISSIIFNLDSCYDSAKCKFYLIRKSFIRHFFNDFSSVKPYWLATHFSHICSKENIAQVDKLLAIDNKKQLSRYQYHHPPRFSIIIPVYNVEGYLSEAINSVLAQDYYNYEIILVNDGSTDSSSQICYEYSQKYKHIVFINKGNAGLSEVRNQGIRIARGEYIMFLDSDDYWRGNNILSDLDKIIQEKSVDMILSRFASVYPNNIIEEYTVSTENLNGEDFAQDLYLLIDNIYYGFAWTKTVKRDIIIKNNIFFLDGSTYEDVLWSFNLAKQIKRYAFYEPPYYMYRRDRDCSITSSPVNKKKCNDMFHLFNLCKEDLINNNEYNDNLRRGLRLFIVRFGRYMKGAYDLLSQHDKDSTSSFYEEFIQGLEQLKKGLE